jgi:hypothetical protein
VAVLAAILWIADQRPTRPHMDSLKIRDAISAARFMRLDRDAAARVSFPCLWLIVAALVLFIISTAVRAVSF